MAYPTYFYYLTFYEIRDIIRCNKKGVSGDVSGLDSFWYTCYNYNSFNC